jgi:hypothetical protein
MAKPRPVAINHNFQTTTNETREFRTWFRGEHTHYNPTRAQLMPAEAVQDFVLKGWMPDAPMISRATRITAFGSCFAANISNWLAARNFRLMTKGEDAQNAYVVSCGEGMVNSFVIRQQFEWAWEDKDFEQPLWHGYDKREYGYDPEIQARTKALFDETDVFILTFGLSEVWYDEPTGNVFWRTIPKDVYDPKRHKFRISTVDENRKNIDAIYKLIRKHRPDAKIIISLSPIPLIATFRDNSCLTSNSVSKAVLRVAIDEIMRKYGKKGVIHYWPSYELVTDVFHLPYKPDRRHPQRIVLDYIMTLFEHVWCEADDTDPAPPLADAWVRALAVSGQLPMALDDIVAHRRPWRMMQMLSRDEPFDADPRLDRAIRRLLRDVRSSWIDPGEEAEADAAQS